MKKTPLTRSRGLSRTTPLARTSSLTRTPLRRDATDTSDRAASRAGLKRTPMVKKPPRNGRVPQRVYTTVMFRNQGRCEGGIPGVCQGDAGEFHHRRSRAVGRNPHTVGNGAALCSACHHYITHVSPAEGKRRGLVVSRHFDGDPGTQPMLVPNRGWVLLAPLGTYIPAREPEGL